MYITTRKTIDMETGVTLLLEGHVYSGIVWACKGDSTASNAEKNQNAFDKQLMTLFQAQYGKQSAITDFLTKQMEPLISKGGQGYTPAQLTAMRTGASDALSTQFQGAQRAINATEQRGLPSGVSAQVQGSLMAQEAEQQAAAQNQITTANANLQQQNYWNSVNVLNGQAATENPLGYASSAENSGNTIAGLSEAHTKSAVNSFGGEVGAAFADTVGKGAGALLFGKV